MCVLLLLFVWNQMNPLLSRAYSSQVHACKHGLLFKVLSSEITQSCKTEIEKMIKLFHK